MQQQPLTPEFADACVALWNRCLGAAFPMRRQLMDQAIWWEPNFDPAGSRIALDGDRVIAMVVVKRHQVAMGSLPPQGKGWISALLVDPAYQSRGIGSRLLSEVLAHLRQFSDEAVGLGGDPGHFFPGIPLTDTQALDWFARRGAALGTPVCDLVNPDLSGFVHPEQARTAMRRAPEVTYRPASADDLPALQAFLAAEFPDRWAWEVRRHLETGGRPEDVMLALREGEVVGFARLHCPESTNLGPGTYWAPLFPGRHGGLGPIGVGTGVRGRGVGLSLLSAGIAELRDRSVHSAVIDWTTLVPFYGLVGFRPWRWYVTASLSLTSARASARQDGANRP